MLHFLIIKRLHGDKWELSPPQTIRTEAIENTEYTPKSVGQDHYNTSYFWCGCCVGRGRLSDVGITIMNLDLLPKGCTFVNGALEAIGARHGFYYYMGFVDRGTINVLVYLEQN